MEEASQKSKVYSEISRDIGQVFFASLFIGPLVSGSIDFTFAFYGSLLSIFSWFLSILFIRE